MEDTPVEKSCEEARHRYFALLCAEPVPPEPDARIAWIRAVDAAEVREAALLPS